MHQYNKIKMQHPDALLLFRVGDFYEMFGVDAIKASKILGIILTKRANGSSNIELAGFPHHSMDTYLPKLIRAGERVAICEQLEDPKQTKKIVKRGVTELVTPGVSYNDLVLTHNKNNFLASVSYFKSKVGVAFLDLSTGEFLVGEGDASYVDKLLQSFNPAEVIYQKSKREKFELDFGSEFYSFLLDDWVFTVEYCSELLINQFKIRSLKGFGISKLYAGTIAAGICLHYLKETQHNHTNHIKNLARIEEESYVWMDKFTIKNLELFQSLNEQAKTLFDILDYTLTPMGGRLLRRWLAFPLKDKKEIDGRLNIVEQISKDDKLSLVLKEKLQLVGDLERLVSKVSTGRISPRECKKLAVSLSVLVDIKDACLRSHVNLQKKASEIDLCSSIKNQIDSYINEDAPALLNKGNVINEGVDKNLDELREILFKGKKYLDNMLEREKEKTNISSLKIAYNNVFGYYLEVRNLHTEKVPSDWIRKQTLVNAERYITEELKEYESKIYSAKEEISKIEYKLYSQLISSIVPFLSKIQKNASIIAELDCLNCFADISQRNNYCKPLINVEKSIDIKKGRHPVIEKQMSLENQYVPNDIFLDKENQQIIMLTGPNMSGKSALLRQTALIVLMAQMGCYVPAESAIIGLVDKIFTRVGASDNISSGESTFMIEMNETASILNNLSEDSLILLDEIGRGTSTYDGVSIAWAITEYLHEHPTRAKTLFATHYHELNDMQAIHHRIKNYHVSVRELDNDIIFIRTLKEGGTAHSFGIHVAKMAGMPKILLTRAEQILKKLEAKKVDNINFDNKGGSDDFQLSFFKLNDPVLEQIRDKLRDMDINSLTPIEALLKLSEIKKLTGK